METAYLHEFAKVADCGSFTAAARELHLTQSTLSKHVALLEREFGADLFVRDRSGVSLTEAGGVLYAQARQMEKLLRATELLVRAARDGQGSAGAGVAGATAAQRRAGCRRRLACGRVRHGASLQVPARGRALRARPARVGRAQSCTWRSAASRRVQDELALTRDEVADVLGSVYRKLGVGDKQERSISSIPFRNDGRRARGGWAYCVEVKAL